MGSGQLLLCKLFRKINKGFVFLDVASVGSNKTFVLSIDPEIMPVATSLGQFVKTRNGRCRKFPKKIFDVVDG